MSKLTAESFWIKKRNASFIKKHSLSIPQNNQALIQNMLQAAQGPGDASGIFGLMGY